MKLFAENTIKIISCKCSYCIAIEKDWYWNKPTPVLYASAISCRGGWDNGRGNF